MVSLSPPHECMFSFTPLLQPTIESQLRVEKNLERPMATWNEGK